MDERRAFSFPRGVEAIWQGVEARSSACWQQIKHLSSQPCPEIFREAVKEGHYFRIISKRAGLRKHLTVFS